MHHQPLTASSQTLPPAVIELTYRIPGVYRVVLDATAVAARLRATGQADAAVIAGMIARREIANVELSDDDDDPGGSGLGILLQALAINAHLFGADGPAGEPESHDSPEGYHVWAGPLRAGTAPVRHAGGGRGPLACDNCYTAATVLLAVCQDGCDRDLDHTGLCLYDSSGQCEFCGREDRLHEISEDDADAHRSWLAGQAGAGRAVPGEGSRP